MADARLSAIGKQILAEERKYQKLRERLEASRFRVQALEGQYSDMMAQLRKEQGK